MGALNNALSDPKTMAQVNSLLSSLSEGEGQSGKASAGSGSAPAAVTPDMVKVTQLMSLLGQSSDDEGIALITALRPLLKPETRPKADRVIKLMRVMNAYPLLRESGILDEIF